MRGIVVAVVFMVGVVVLQSVTGHECERPCVVGDTRICQYEFYLGEYHTLSRACYDCPNNLTDCDRQECVPADGLPRPFLAVNKQYPGPAIQVCAGDRVVVDLYNEQLSDSETLHWHGQHMRDHQYYDGVPFLTQCPINQGIFRYNFLADTPGTHFWHSHHGLHRGSGVFGSLVVREAEDPHLGIYDTDLPEHVLVVSDWSLDTMLDGYISEILAADPTFPTTIFINGKGRNYASEIPLPLEVVTVSPGGRHRLRLINAQGLNCPVIVSIDGHSLTIIAVDGSPVIPYTAASIVMYTGERFDVVVEANQPTDNYWIRFNGIMLCKAVQCMAGAVLRYEGAPEADPIPTLNYDDQYPPGIVVNPINSGGGTADEASMVDLTSLQPSTLTEQVDTQFYLAFDINEVNNTVMFNQDLYPYNGVESKWKSMTPQLNGISFRLPFSPPLSQPEAPQPTACLYGQEVDPSLCTGDFCSCTLILEVGLGDTVELVLIDQGTLTNSNHPFHLHGQNFQVVAMGRLGSSTTVEEVAALDAAGGIIRKLDNAAMKDTVIIPDGGYTIVRFTADNPGWWLFHCHLIYHAELGMAAALHVGEDSDLPPPPEGFPTCGYFIPPIAP